MINKEDLYKLDEFSPDGTFTTNIFKYRKIKRIRERE